MKQLITTIHASFSRMTMKQLIAVFFLCFIVVCSAVLASWQISWLNQASQTKLLSAQREMSLDATRLIESSVRQLESILENPQLHQDIVLDQNQIVLNQHTIELVQKNNLDPKWQTIIDNLPTVNSAGFRELEEVLERNLPDHIFFSFTQAQANLSNDVGYLANLYEFDLNNFSQYLMQDFQSDQYYYRWVYKGKVLAENTHSQIANTADLQIPISFYLKDSKRSRSIPRNSNSQLNQEQSNRINVFWIYETVLRRFTAIESSNFPANTLAFDLKLEVFNLDQSLNQSIKNQKIIFRFFSLAILSLLTVTAFFLFYAMHRSQNQRRLEQEFTATVSHELRTPLTVIQSAADNLSEGFVNKPESIIRYGNEIKNQSQRLNRMIESTLLYSGMPNQSKAKEDTIQTAEFLDEILIPLTQLANNNHIEIFNKQQALPQQIITDSNALRMILENLIMNCIIHGQSEKTASKIWFTISIKDNDYLLIEVQDNGTGIAKKEQKQVFKAFVRGKKSEQNQHPGSGLGLNLIKRMVDVLSGSITLNSPYINSLGLKENGTQFTVTLPIKFPATQINDATIKQPQSNKPDQT